MWRFSLGVTFEVNIYQWNISPSIFLNIPTKELYIGWLCFSISFQKINIIGEKELLEQQEVDKIAKLN